MNIHQRMAIQGVILGCLLVAAFGWIVTANAADLQPPALANSGTSGATGVVLPPMVERLDNQDMNINTDDSGEDLFESSIAYSPDDIAQDSDSQSGGSIDNINIQCQVNPDFPDSILEWCDLITYFAEQNNLDPNLIAALILQESGGQHLAYSHSGAVGLMQVMPRDGIAASFMCKNGPCFSSRPTISELQDPQYNVAYGTRMLAGLQDRFGNIRDALKSYGPMDVGYSYADKVLSLRDRYGD